LVCCCKKFLLIFLKIFIGNFSFTGEPLNAYIPRTEDLLDLTNQINDPWLTQPSAGIQGGSCGDAGVVCPGDVSTATFAVPQNQV
tara:strand:+ start:675 stop:929 length:255 start_codon:yes stop_codon:yes gene_type:complete